MSAEDVPWLTVVTVAKDAAADLAMTAASVAQQDLGGVEYLVVDSSTDRESTHKALADVPHRYLWVMPAGIYPAMNVGLREARGDYVYFANAGDRLFSADVLGRVRSSLSPAMPGWAYGEVEIVQRDGARVVTPRWDYARERASFFANGYFPPHQGTFVRRDLLLAQGGFDPAFSIVADYAACLKLSEVEDPQYLDMIVANFTEGGVSTTQWRESLRQFHRARRQILPLTGWRSLEEFARTARQFAAMTLYRDVLARVRRP